MPVRGIKQVRSNITKLLGKIDGPMSEKALEEVLFDAEGFAITMIPVVTGNLRDHRIKRVEKTSAGFRGSLIYTSEYAAAVHNAPGTLKGSGLLRDPSNPGDGKFWDPSGEPEFLTKAFELPEFKAALDATIKRNMKL